MKKILLIATVCIFSSALYAQVTSPVSFGVHAGLINTKIETEIPSVSEIQNKADNGMMLGAFMRLTLDKWYIQPELNLASRKTKITIDGENGEFKKETMDIPMLMGYKIVKLPIFKLRAFAGPVASFKINHSFSSTLEEQFKKESFDGASWHAKVGAGIDVWKFTLDVDYEFGLTDVSAEFMKKNKMVNVTLGFRFL